MDHAKSLRRREEKSVPQELQDWGPNPERRYSQKESRRILEITISKLAPGYHTVFHLRDIEGFSSKEAAQSFHLSLATVKSRSRRARLQLRDSLDVYFRRTKGKKKATDAGARKRSAYAPTAAVLYPVTTMPAGSGRPVVHRVEATKEKEKCRDRNHCQDPTAAQSAH